MKKYDADGLHYWSPAKKLGGGWICHKDTPSAPAPPNPVETSNAQTASNIATAQANAALNRVNQYTPWGNLEYTRTPAQSSNPQMPIAENRSGNAQLPAQPSAPTSRPLTEANGYGISPNNPEFWAGSGMGPVAQSPSTAAQPTQSSNGGYNNGGADNIDQWSATVTLSPEQQALLNQQNQISQSLGNLGISQLGTVSEIMGKPIDYSGAPSQVTNVQSGPLSSNVQSGPLVSSAGYGSIQDRLDLSKVPELVGGDALGQAMRDAQQAAYNQQTGYLDPRFSQERHDLENKLVQQGVMQNSDAWNRAMGDFERNKTFAYTDAFNNSVGLGNAAQSQLFNQGLAANQNAYGQALGSGQFANQAQAQGFGQSMSNAQLANQAQGQMFNQGLMNAQLNNQAQGQGFNQGVTNANLANQGRSQYLNELMSQRQNPLNELNALRTGAQVTSPQFSNVPQAQVLPTDVVGPINTAYQGQIAGNNAQVASNNATTGAVGGLAAAGLTAALGSGAGGAMAAALMAF